MQTNQVTPAATASSKTSGAKNQGDAAQDVNATFKLQQASRWRVARTTAAERVQKLERLKVEILRRQDDLRAAMHADFRKPAAEVDLTELQPVLAEINHTAKHLDEWMEPMNVGTPITLVGTSSRVHYEAKGLVLILSPWNYPFNLLMSPLVAAVAAGNCVCVRPSDKVRHTSQLIKEILEAVFPRDEVAVFTGASSVANALLALPFDHVLFTGSTRIGKQVMAAAANHLASVTLELGGQSPVIVDETADVALAAERIVWGKFLNAGQTCVAPNHVFVHESRLGEFTAHAKKIVESRYGSTPEARHQSPDLARIVDEAGCKRLGALVTESIHAGATLVVGGHCASEERYLEPTVLSGVTDTSPVMREEIFGPILPVLSYSKPDEVFASIRSRGKPLAMYIFSGDQDRIDEWLAESTAGGTVVNNTLIHLGNPNLPFGGVGESGFGNYHGPFGFRTFSHERAVLTQGWFSPLKHFYPPYGPSVRKYVSFLTRFLS